MTGPRPGFHRGVTLVEIMVAGAIFSLLATVLFQGAALAARLAQENAEFLAADAFAFDLAWKRFHEDYSKLKALQGRTIDETLTATAVPALCGHATYDAPKATTKFAWAKNRSNASDQTALCITVDIEWGHSDNRRHRSVTVCRSERGQEEAKQ